MRRDKRSPKENRVQQSILINSTRLFNKHFFFFFIINDFIQYICNYYFWYVVLQIFSNSGYVYFNLCTNFAICQYHHLFFFQKLSLYLRPLAHIEYYYIDVICTVHVKKITTQLVRLSGLLSHILHISNIQNGCQSD